MNTCLSESTIGRGFRYIPVNAGIALIVATSILNPQPISKRGANALKVDAGLFLENPWEECLDKSFSTGGITIRNKPGGELEIYEKTDPLYIDEVESPIMHAKNEFKITLKIKSIVKGITNSNYEIEG